MFNMNFIDMKKILYIAICLLLGLGMSACFEDEGNYEYHELPAFYVDTVGVQTALTITQFDALSMESHLVYEGDKSGLEFTWSIYAGSSHGSDVFADTLAKTENLSATIEASPGNYTIEFCAMEKATGVRTTMCYAVTVESATGTGLLVYYQKDGTADCDLIKTPLFNGTLTESTVTRQIYSQANPDYPLTGELVGCGFLNSGNTSWVTLMTETDAVQLSYEDMSIMREFDEMFWSAPETCKPQGYYFANSLEVLVNDGKVYTDIISWAEKPLFASAKILMNDDYQSASCAYAGYGQTLIVYDELKGRFLYSNVFSSELLEIDYDPAKSAYDMTAIGEKTCLYMDRGYSNESAWYGYAVMKDKSTNEHSCYVYVTNTAISGCYGIAVLDLAACEEIEKAQYYAFGRRGPVLYYATNTAIYKVNYDLNTQEVVPASDAAWTCPAGETITSVRMFVETGLDLEESADSKYLLVSTYNGSEGKLYVLGADVVSGSLSIEPMEIFIGFGEIKDVVFKSK